MGELDNSPRGFAYARTGTSLAQVFSLNAPRLCGLGRGCLTNPTSNPSIIPNLTCPANAGSLISNPSYKIPPSRAYRFHSDSVTSW